MMILKDKKKRMSKEEMRRRIKEGRFLDDSLNKGKLPFDNMLEKAKDIEVPHVTRKTE